MIETNRQNLILAYHGCDKYLRDRVVNGLDELLFSDNEYDWLGPGIYFWENSYERALQFAKEWSNERVRSKPAIANPSVLGVVLALGNCLDLLDTRYISTVRTSYEEFVDSMEEGAKMPENYLTEDRILRHLDCAVIRYLHATNEARGIPSYDSVRAVFFEGAPLYKNAGFRDKNHIQICIRNRACIKGYFLPIEDRKGSR